MRASIHQVYPIRRFADSPIRRAAEPQIPLAVLGDQGQAGVGDGL